MLGRDAKIPHPSLQWRAFVHRPASGEFKAPFGDAEAGRGDPDRRLQLFRHAGQVLPCRSLGILPDAGDLRLEQRARRHEVGIESRQTLLEALRLRQRRFSREHLFDAGPRQFNEVHDGFSAIPTATAPCVFVQLDLFCDRPNSDWPLNAVSLQPFSPSGIVGRKPDCRSSPKQRLPTLSALWRKQGRGYAAVLMFIALCNRFRVMASTSKCPKAVALEALGVIGGPDALRAVVQLIVRKIVQGPTSWSWRSP